MIGLVVATARQSSLRPSDRQNQSFSPKSDAGDLGRLVSTETAD